MIRSDDWHVTSSEITILCPLYPSCQDHGEYQKKSQSHHCFGFWCFANIQSNINVVWEHLELAYLAFEGLCVLQTPLTVFSCFSLGLANFQTTKNEEFLVIMQYKWHYLCSPFQYGRNKAWSGKPRPWIPQISWTVAQMCWVWHNL